MKGEKAKAIETLKWLDLFKSMVIYEDNFALSQKDLARSLIGNLEDLEKLCIEVIEDSED